MELLKVRLWVLGWVQLRVNFSSRVAGVLVRPVCEVGLAGSGVIEQSAGPVRLVVMLMFTGVVGPLLAMLLWRQRTVFVAALIWVGGALVQSPASTCWLLMVASAWVTA